jgi:hypothetical protein
MTAHAGAATKERKDYNVEPCKEKCIRKIINGEI